MGAEPTSTIYVAFLVLIFDLTFACLQPPNCKCQRVGVTEDPFSMVAFDTGDAQLRAKCHCDYRGEIPEAFRNYAMLEIDYQERVVLTNESFVNASFPDLLYLVLAGVQHVEPGGFTSLERTEHLFLKKSFVHVLVKNMFMPLERLLQLDASGGDIYAIQEGAFLGLRRLWNLSLQHNSIRSISRDSFLGLDSLTDLDLSYNNLLHLRAETFLRTPKLFNIKLQNNNISRVDPYTFINLTCPGTCTINLRDNQLEFIPEPKTVVRQEQHGHWSLITVLLDGNHLRCDCHMNWISFWVDDQSKYVSGKCFFPREYRDRGLTSFYAHGLVECHDNDTEVGAKEGSQFELTCPIGDPTWITPGANELQGQGDTRFDHFFITDSDSLIIWNTQLRDGGTYICLSEDGSERMVYRLAVRSDRYPPISLSSNAWIALAFGTLVVGVLVVMMAVTSARWCVQRRGYKVIDREVPSDVPDNQPVDEGCRENDVASHSNETNPTSHRGRADLPSPTHNRRHDAAATRRTSLVNDDNDSMADHPTIDNIALLRGTEKKVVADIHSPHVDSSPSLKYNHGVNMNDSSISNIISK